jgi:predicted Zn-dependent peptidase
MTRSAAVVVFVGAVFAVALAAQTPDRRKPPATGQAPTLKLPAIQKRQLANGLPVWLVEVHDVPVAQISLVVLGGSADDPAGQYGIASLTASMLTEGAGGRNALDLADAVDFLGANLTSSAGIDATTIRLQVPVSRLADALPIMSDVALRPTFPPQELERVRQQRLVSLLQARDDPASVAGLAFSRVLYGSSHRFGVAAMGTAATLKAFTPENLRAFYNVTYRPERAALLVTGDVTLARVHPLLEAAFGSWRATGPAAPRVTLSTPPPPAARTVYLIDKPGAPQSQIRIGRVGVPRSTPDFFPLQVMNTVLGGSFTSRLNLNLREKRGYSYGAASVFDMRVAPGPFYATAGVQTDKTSESLTEFFNELNGILQPVPDDELTRGKNYVALRFPSGFETSGDLARRLEDALVYNLGDDYFAKYIPAIQAVTAADVQRVARAYIQPDRVAVVVVGDRKVIEPGIKALNLGPITIMSVDEIF